MTANKKTNKTLINLNVILIAAFALAAFAYIALVANMLRMNYALEEAEHKMAVLENKNNELRLSLSEVSSLDYLISASENLNYTEIQNVSYIKKPSVSPFAAR